jgi:hypothetical protein
MRNVRLTGLFTLRSPLSHIGEAISTTSYLVQEPIIQVDGSVEEVFCYSGNAWRGQLRDLAATYMLEQIGSPRLPLDAFHLLFSGGRIGGEQVVDIERARVYRRTVPMIGVWGGGVGNQILPGKLRVSNCYPLCIEASPILRDEHLEAAGQVSYRSLTFEKSFSRKDDAKDDRLAAFLPMTAGQALLTGADPATPIMPPAREKREKDGPADQMRMTSELLAAGSKLQTEIEVLDATEIEVGCLVSALHLFSRSPHIGGQANKGHGKVSLHYDYTDLDTGEMATFLSVTDGPCLLSPPAAEAKDSYDRYLRSQYEAMLASQGGEIRALLGAGA